MNTRICISIGAATPEAALAQMEAAVEQADVIEVRLDLLDELSLQPFLGWSKRPLLFTNRASWEGGQFKGAEEDRLQPLCAAIRAGCAYVDLELRAPQSSWDVLRSACAGRDCRLIASWHDFTATPDSPTLTECLHLMQRCGADIGKLVTMATTEQDALRVLALLAEADRAAFPLIAFAMGEAGVISRVATTALGGYMSYCAPETGGGTAPGQVRASVLRSIQALLEVA